MPDSVNEATGLHVPASRPIAGSTLAVDVTANHVTEREEEQTDSDQRRVNPEGQCRDQEHDGCDDEAQPTQRNRH